MAIDVLHMTYKAIKLNHRHGNDLYGVKLGVEIEIESIDRNGNVIPGSKKKTSAIEKDTGVNYYHRRVRQLNILTPLAEKTLALNFMRCTMSQHGQLTCKANKFNTFIITNYNLLQLYRWLLYCIFSFSFNMEPRDTYLSLFLVNLFFLALTFFVWKSNGFEGKCVGLFLLIEEVAIFLFLLFNIFLASDIEDGDG